MAITTTTINGTDSIAATRITINDNMETLKSALNSILSIIDISTGKINNYGYGSDNDMETEDLIIRGSAGGGVSVISGGISIGNGNLVIGGTSGTGFIQIGAGTDAIYVTKVTKNLTTGTVPTMNFSGSGATGGTGSVGYLTLPRLSTAVIQDIQGPALGSIVFDVDTLQVKVCTVSGTTGTWTAL